MDTHELEQKYLAAGTDYLSALRKLGLEPDGLFWARDDVVGHCVLVLVTSLYDHAGPYALSDKLFKAYNFAATPREIDPFIVRLHSPQHSLIQQWSNMVISKFEFHGPDGQPIPLDLGERTYGGGGLNFKHTWVYKFPQAPKKRTPVEASRQWQRFQKNVDRLAA